MLLYQLKGKISILSSSLWKFNKNYKRQKERNRGANGPFKFFLSALLNSQETYLKPISIHGTVLDQINT